jgi:D-tyrosyl-tRNA(Tyr) deacylase
MRALVQRVSSARVVVAGEVVGAIDAGLLILLGIAPTDTEVELRWMAEKCARLRIFGDGEGKMNRSVLDTGGSILAVSQFTLYGDANKGNRPSFIDAARPELAEPLYQKFLALLGELITPERVAAGRFGADMKVELTNDGPVTLWIEREPSRSAS